MPKAISIDAKDEPLSVWGEPGRAVFQGAEKAINKAVVDVIRGYVLQALEEGSLWVAEPDGDQERWTLRFGAYDDANIIAAWSLREVLTAAAAYGFTPAQRADLRQILEEAILYLK